jgi:hypothetical protein
VAGIWDSQYLVALHRDGVHGIAHEIDMLSGGTIRLSYHLCGSSAR